MLLYYLCINLDQGVRNQIFYGFSKISKILLYKSPKDGGPVPLGSPSSAPPDLDGRISQFHFLSILRNSNNLEFQIFSVTRFFWRQTLTLEYYKEPIFNFLNRSEQ